MWIYEQKSGWLISPEGKKIAQGYSGAGEGRNNPDMQMVKDVGPIPCGLYTIHAPVDTVTHGPYVMRLEPASVNEMFDRAGFLLHGDSVVNPGTASLGCPVLPRYARERVGESSDKVLEVVKG